MSWGLINTCGNCMKNQDCKDAQHIQKGITAVHEDQEGHKGAGNVIMTCFKMIAKN